MSSQVTMRSRWAVALQGDSLSIENLKMKINGSVSEPKSLFVGSFNAAELLGTSAWDAIDDAETVKAYAEETLRLLSGCLFFLDFGTTITVGSIFEFTDDNYIQRFIAPFSITVQKAAADRATPSRFRGILNFCERHEHLGNCLALLGPGPEHGWFDVYKAIEELEGHFGSETAMLHHRHVKKKEMKQAKQMANSFRHAGKVHKPPNLLMTLEEAKKVVTDTLERIFAGIS
jgi:hypothetical protein